MAATVIVIMSRGIPKIPIKPSMKDDAKILGIIPAILSFIDLNKKIIQKHLL